MTDPLPWLGVYAWLLMMDIVIVKSPLLSDESSSMQALKPPWHAILTLACTLAFRSSPRQTLCSFSTQERSWVDFNDATKKLISKCFVELRHRSWEVAWGKSRIEFRRGYEAATSQSIKAICQP